MATELGQNLNIGAGTITGSYIVDSRDEGDKDIDLEDIMDEDGLLNTRIIFNSFDKFSFSLIVISGGLPLVDFIMGEISAHPDFTTLYVESATVSSTKSAQRVAVTLSDLGIT